MWVPHKELKNKNQTIKISKGRMQPTDSSVCREFFFFIQVFFSFIFFLRFTETCPSDFVGINTKSALRDEGYA